MTDTAMYTYILGVSVWAREICLLCYSKPRECDVNNHTIHEKIEYTAVAHEYDRYCCRYKRGEI